MKRALIAIAAVMLLALLALAALVTTQPGLQLALRLVAPLVPGEIAIERLAGRLVGPIELDGLDYRLDGKELRIDDLSLDWQPLRLFSRHLHFDRVHATGVTWSAPATTATDTAGPDPALPQLPLAITADSVRITDINLRSGDQAMQIASIGLSGRLDDSQYRIDELTLRSELLDLDGTAQVSLSDNPAIELALDWATRLQRNGDAVAADGVVTASGTAGLLDYSLLVQGALEAQLTGTATGLLATPVIDGRLQLERIDPALAGFDSTALRAALDYRLEDDSFALDGNVEAPQWLPQPADIDVRGRYSAGQVELQQFDASLDSRATAVKARGQLRTDLSELALDVDWTELRWPLDGDALVASTRGSAQLSGSLEQYRLSADATALAATLPSARITLRASGTPSGLAIEQMRAQLEQAGTLQGSGRLDWRPDVVAALRLSGDTIELARLAAALEGQVSFNADVGARLDAQGPRLQVELHQLDGNLRGKTLSGSGRLDYSPQRIELQKLQLQAGAARIAAHGNIGEQVDLSWNLDIPDLALLLPQASGKLRSEGTALGSRKRPALEGELQASGLRLATLSASSLSSTFRIGLDAASSATIVFDASGAGIGELSLGEISGRSEGTIGAHRIAVILDGEFARAQAQLRGGLDGDRWRGQLESLDFRRADTGPWSLDAAVPLSVDADRVQSAQACLRQSDAALCADVDWARAQPWRSELRLSQLPLASLAPFLPPGLNYEGTLTGSAEVADPGAGLVGSARLELSVGRVYTTTDGEQDVLIGFRDGVVDTRFDSTSANAMLQLDLRDAGRIEADLVLPLRADATLGGTVYARIENLSLVPALMPQVGSIDGRIEARLDVSGTRSAPDFAGNFALQATKVSLPDLGITLTDTVADVFTRGDQLRFEGRTRSGDGGVQLDGQLRWSDGQPTGELRLAGERFRAIDLPEIWLDATPELTVSVSGRDIGVEGAVTVPAANITPIELDTGVKPTSDQVIVGHTEKDTETEDWRIDGRVRVSAGDDVTIKGFGLEGRLSGSVLIIDPPGQPTTARGSLEVLDGRYSAYGQKLSIETGRLEFTGGPVDNPGLDLLATRDTGEVVAGVQVRGELRQPVLSLYSVPALPDTQAMSYLVAGRGLEELDEAGQLAVNDAATRLALQGGSLLAASLGRGLGLDSVGLEDSGEIASTALVIGKHLSPRLYVSYGIGLFEAINTLRLRYRINSHLTLETESGVRTSADLLYSVER